ncbi:hypothetical protein KBD08_01775 [Candidatus Babeliales bacterium]|nr:hypothetical protein [Candidatus Babeliales bacterium]
MLYRSRYCKFVVCFLVYAYASVFAGEGSDRVTMLPSNKDLSGDDIGWLQNNLNTYLGQKGYFEHADFKGMVNCFARRNKPKSPDRQLIPQETDRLVKGQVPFLVLNTGYSVLQHVLGDCDWYIKNGQYSKAHQKMCWIVQVLRYNNTSSRLIELDANQKLCMEQVLLNIVADPCKCVMFRSRTRWQEAVDMLNKKTQIENQEITLQNYLLGHNFVLADVMLRDQGRGIVFSSHFMQLCNSMRDGQSLDVVQACIASWAFDKQHLLNLADKNFNEDDTACMSEEDTASVSEEIEYREIERFKSYSVDLK